MTNTCFIILAAGQGSRFGRKKQFLEINGKPLWQHVKNKALNFTEPENVVVVGVDIEGGITRSQSVVCGLKYFKKMGREFDKIVILEAARPLITLEQINNAISADSDSVTFAMPLTSTIIRKNGEYLDRNDCLLLSTPVCFNYNLFSNAYLSGKYFDLTDDTFVMYSEYGIKPTLLEGSENLVKLTYSSDLAILELLMNKYSL